MTRILGREGADPRMSGLFFKAVIQAVLLFGSETWVLTPRMEGALGSVQHRVAQQMTGSHMRRLGGILRWRQLWRRRVLKRSGYTSKIVIIRSCNILRCDRFWTYVRNMFGGQEPVFLEGGYH